MKMAKLLAVAVLLCGIAVMFGTSDASAAAVPVKGVMAHGVDYGFYAAQFVLAVGADSLRAQHAELVRQASATIAEVQDGMPADAVSAIEARHRSLLENVRTVADALAAEERRLASAAPPVATAEEGTRAERTRTTQLLDIGARANMESTAVQAAIVAGTTVEVFRAEAFNVMAQRSNGSRTTAPHAQMGRDETETRRTGMTDAIVARMARAGRRPGEAVVVIPEHARAYGEMGLIEMAAECIGHRGHIRNARQIEEVMQRAMMSTSDFPAIFQDAINRRLLGRYQAATPIYRRIAAPYHVGDFRVSNVVRAGDFPSLQPITETGKIKDGTFSESKETIRALPYGVKFNLSRQMIVNDNLGAIDQILGSAGDRVTDWENNIVMTLVASNPTLLTDTKAIFQTADHGNYTSAGTAIAVASVGIGRAAMAKQTSLDGMKLNLEPAIILGSPDTRTVAEQLVTTITPAASANVVPESIRRIVPLSDANLTGNAWYLFADPNIAPCFLYALLDGFEGPRLSTEQMFGSQGIGVQLEHDFGAAGVDYRGGYKNAGA